MTVLHPITSASRFGSNDPDRSPKPPGREDPPMPDVVPDPNPPDIEVPAPEIDPIEQPPTPAEIPTPDTGPSNRPVM